MDVVLKKSPLSSESKERLLKLNGYESTDIKVDPGNWTLPNAIDLEKIKNFTVFEDDIWIVTLPKCGTTWMQELTWLIMNDIDIEKSKINQFFRVPFLELDSIVKSYPIKEQEIEEFEKYPEGMQRNEETVNWFMKHSMEYANRLNRPRIIKSHLPLSLLPNKLLDTCKVIYVARNIKDAAVSRYHHLKLSPGLQEDFKQFAICFLKGDIKFNPFIPHILEAWEARKHQNMFFTTYEEMKTDLRKETLKLVSFLRGPEKRLPNSSIDKLLKAVDIESFRKNVFVNKSKEVPADDKGNGFIRKGVIGDWKNYFDEEMNDEWDGSIESQLLGTEYTMIFEDSQLVLKDL